MGLSEEHPEVEKVTFVDEETKNNTESIVAPIVEKSDSPLPIIVGASCAALIALLGAYLFGKRKFFISKGTDKGEIFDIQMIPGASKDFGSFIAADSKELGKVGTCMDVHRCKSATCPKCYENPPIDFVPTPRNNNVEKW